MKEHNNLWEIVLVVVASSLVLFSVASSGSPLPKTDHAGKIVLHAERHGHKSPTRARAVKRSACGPLHTGCASNAGNAGDFCKAALSLLCLFLSAYILFHKRGQVPVPEPERTAYAPYEPAASTKGEDAGTHPLPEGTFLQDGHLEVIGRLGTGGMSAIYLVQKDGSQLFCLKEAIIPPYLEKETREKAKELFEREARLLSKLSHPQIAKVLDYFHEGGRDFLLLDLICGISLRELVRHKGPQNPRTVLAWAREVASVLDYLHNQPVPVVHRDLTPDNLVLRQDNSIVLIDFGAANEFIGPITGTSIGKRPYMPPEQFRGKASPASDIYALGATMHFLMTGIDPEPLSRAHPRAQSKAIAKEIDDLVALLTEQDQNKRLISAKVVIAEVDKILSKAGSRREVLIEPFAAHRLLA